LTWVLPRFAVVLTVALGLSSDFLLLYMPSLWLSLEAGGAEFDKGRSGKPLLRIESRRR
jgi:hypothetical protein